MKTDFRKLLLSGLCAGLIPLALLAQSEQPPSGEKSQPAPQADVTPAESDTAKPAPEQGTGSEESVSEPAATAEPTPEPATPAAEEKSGELRRIDIPEDSPAADEKREPAAAQPARRHSNDRVSIGGNARLRKDESAEAVVAIGGNATNEGEVWGAVVAVAGNASSTGPVGDAVVAVFGNAYVNSKASEVVAVMGNVELGPQAEIHGDVVCVGGSVTRDPNAVVHGSIPEIGIGTLGLNAPWISAYFRNCVLKGRPLAFGEHMGWAWMIAGAFLLLYVVLGLLFSRGVTRCAETLETRPGRSILAAILTMVLTPILFIILSATMVGIPFVIVGSLCLTLFGKAVMLAWIGRRITLPFGGQGLTTNAALPILIGGLIVMALYLIPFVGFIVYKLLGMLGMGVVVYTIILSGKRDKPTTPPVAPVYAAAGGPAPMASSGFSGTAAATGVAAEPTVVIGAVPPPIAVAVVPAGFWIRMGALFIDVVLVAIIMKLAASVTFGLFPVAMPGLLVFLAIYGAILWKMRGTTIGGIVCGLRVVRTDGRQIDWATASVRALGCFLSLAVVGLGFIWVAIDPEKQSWHDKIAGTAVVYARGGNVSLV